MKITAGQLDRRISIEQKSTATDANYGTPTVTWVPLVAAAGSPTVAQRFAAQVQDVLPSRTEGVALGLNIARSPTRIRIRYRSDIDSSMRVTVHGTTDTVYQIIGGPSEIGRKEFTELLCERISS